MLINALIYLCAAVVSVPIAKRLGLGSVLGYLLAGVLIGPFVLHLVGDQSDVMHFAEFGVVMMLFLIGLELQPRRLWEMRRPILGLGALQVVLTTLVVTLGVFAIAGLHLKTSIAIGLAIALSSTAIVLQSLSEKNLLKTEAGNNAFAVLLFQDIAVIPILAMLPLLATTSISHGENGHHGSLIGDLPVYAQFLVSTAIIALIIVGGKFLSRPVFRFIAETQLREIFTVFALLIVIAIAALMHTIGLSPALGTFLAGVILAESEFRHELEVNIEPFKGLLLGLFFITVGASIDFNLLFEQPVTIALCVAALFSIKAGVLALLAKLFRMTFRHGLLFSLALAQGGEFAFVIVSASKQFSVFNTELSNLITVVVALSMLISPLLLVVYELVMSRPSQTSRSEKFAEETITATDQVIIAGYGRFGQIIGRLLRAQGYHLTILDHSPSQIDLVRRFGSTVFYGDAARHDLLEAAGAKEAKLLVVAVDEPDKCLEIIQAAQEHFPNIKIIARAFDRRHAYEIMNTGIESFRRETFDSALYLGVEALKVLGHDASTAERYGDIFLKHDEETLVELSQVWGDDKNYGHAIRQRQEDLAQVLQSDEKREQTDQ